MPLFEPHLLPSLSRNLRTDCPECRGSLALMRVIRSRAGSEYWTMRCTRCGGIHLDIVNPRHPAPEHDNAPAA